MDSFLKKAGLVAVLFAFFSHGLLAESGINSNPVEKAPIPKQHNNAAVPVAAKRFFILPEYKILHSTHGDNFVGGDVIFTYKVSQSLFLGMGTGFSYNKYHGDNGWELYSLRFFPVFADAKLFLPGNTHFKLFLQLSDGVSINHYRRKDRLHQIPYLVSERGDYLYTGIGCVLKISKYLRPVIGVGFNGFHMSFNSFDVNPHGFTFRIGLLI